MRRLRQLTEAECYARLYGGWEATVQFVRIGLGSPRHAPVSGEDLRTLFEEKLDERGLPLEAGEAEAA